MTSLSPTQQETRETLIMQYDFFPTERADNRPIHDMKYKESSIIFQGAAVSRLYITPVKHISVCLSQWGKECS